MRRAGEFATGVAGILLAGIAFAHGGISAIGALLPFFIALWSLGLLMTIWLFYSIAMFMLSVTSITPRKQKIFKIYSWFVAGIFIFLALASTLMVAWVIFLGALFMAGFVIFISNAILARNERRMASQ